jgi:hypothetical protein
MQIKREGMIAWVDRESDERFRKLLIHGAPAPIARKIFLALAKTPQANAREEAEKHFGAELQSIVERTTPLITALEDYFDSIGAKNFTEWLTVTGYGNSYELISAFADWAAMKKSDNGQFSKTS